MKFKKKTEVKTKEQVNIQNIVGYIAMSFDDYIAARILFNNNKLLQACILANTAIEKYFKALMAAQGEKPFGMHDITKQLPFIDDKYPGIYANLNIEFLSQLTKIYKARYLDHLPLGYNFTIIQGKYLAELDFIFSIIEPTLRFPDQSGNISKTRYELSVENKDPYLWTSNYILNKTEKKLFIETPCYIQEFRVLPSGIFIEIIYESNSVKNDNKFDYNALIPSINLQTFIFTHISITNTSQPVL